MALALGLPSIGKDRQTDEERPRKIGQCLAPVVYRTARERHVESWKEQ